MDTARTGGVPDATRSLEPVTDVSQARSISMEQRSSRIEGQVVSTLLSVQTARKASTMTKIERTVTLASESMIVHAQDVIRIDVKAASSTISLPSQLENARDVIRSLTTVRDALPRSVISASLASASSAPSVGEDSDICFHIQK